LIIHAVRLLLIRQPGNTMASTMMGSGPRRYAKAKRPYASPFR
jgi:hypothetical protein